MGGLEVISKSCQRYLQTQQFILFFECSSCQNLNKGKGKQKGEWGTGARHNTNTITMTQITHSDLESYSTLNLIKFIDSEMHELSLQHTAKKLISHRMGQVQLATPEALEKEYARPDRPNWYKLMIIDELERRNAFQQRKKAKEKERTTYVQNKPKQKRSAFYKLMSDDPKESIFKIKWQFKEPTAHGHYWLTKKYSRDYQDERQFFKNTSTEAIRNLVKQKGDFGYELFDKNGLKEKGYNGFMYSIKIFESLQMANKIRFFAIYLNNISDPHINGNLYSMEIWRWGELKSFSPHQGQSIFGED